MHERQRAYDSLLERNAPDDSGEGRREADASGSG